MISIAKILFDFDDVLNDLSNCWVRELNRRYGYQVPWESVTAYDLRLAFPELSAYQIFAPYLDGTVYLDVNPPKGAMELVEELAAEHELYLATSNLLGVDTVTLYEYLWNGAPTRSVDYLLQYLGQYYPAIRQDNIIVACKKNLIQGDVLIDDNPENLKTFYGLRILLDKPYNRDLDTERFNIRRAMSYRDVARIIREETSFC